MNPTLVLGGTFDPPHAGHSALLHAASSALGFRNSLFLIAAAPAHKGVAGAAGAARVSAAEHRLSMLRLAVGALDTQDARPASAHLAIDTRELERFARDSKPSYTIDSLREIRAEIGADSPLVFVLGWDQWLKLPTWHRWQELLDVAHLCVAPRVSLAGAGSLGLPPAALDEWTRFKFASAHALRQSACGLIFQLPEFDQAVSSSALRAAINHGQTSDVDAWLEPAVLRYINEQQLYR